MNGLPYEPTSTTNDASVKVPLMTGFRRSRKSSDNRKHGMLTFRIVVDTPMIGTTRSRVSFFMNKFRKLGFIEYNGGVHVHSYLLNIVLHD